MRTLFTFLLLFSTLLLASQTKDPYKNIQYFELKNGLKVYLLSDKKSTNTEIKLEVKVGKSVENSQNAGIGQLLKNLIFRDQRVPYKDYIDYLEEEGATYIEGYIGEDTTVYEATIDASKSYFLVNSFASMLFDKKLNYVDLEVEQRALQTEIGDVKWYNTLAFYTGKSLRYLREFFPPSQNVFVDSFNLLQEKEQFSIYQQKLNNPNFTLQKVMQHYNDYYYPKNMTLKIAGNFNVQRMKNLIKHKYGVIKKEGNKTSPELEFNAKLSQLPFKLVTTGKDDSNVAYIGARYLLDDYKKHLILLAYSEHLANKTQQLLKNRLGQTYSVKVYQSRLKDAALVGVVLQSLHRDFDENIELIKKKIENDVLMMPKEEIQEALKQAELYYTSLEHDTQTLLSLIQTKEFLRQHYEIYNQTAYEILKEITPSEFQKVLTKSFRPRFSFEYIYRDYYIFPFDMAFFLILFILSIGYTAKRMSKLSMIKKNIIYSQRDVRFSRRLTSHFLAITVMGFILLLSLYVNMWAEYYFFTHFFNDPHFANSLDKPWNYLYGFFDLTFLFLIFITITLIFFRKFFTRIDVTQNNIYIVGVSIDIVNKFEIQEIKKVSWGLAKKGKIYGLKILFFRSVVMIRTKERTFYLRSKSASELEEDLIQWQKGCNQIT